MNAVPFVVRVRAIYTFSLLAGLLLATSSFAQSEADVESLDPEKVALAYHKITGKPVDFDRHVNLSPKVAGPMTFDKPDIIKQERARLQALYDAGSKDTVWTDVINDSIGQYDHDKGLFPVGLFQPGIYVQYPYHFENYQLVFANSGAAAAIKMPNKEEARAFDQQLQQRGRSVRTVVKYRLIGDKDPQGAVTGDRVMLAELVSVKLFDRNGQVVYAPDIQAVADAPPPAKFVASEVDIAGMRVGGDADDLKAALERLYSAKVVRFDAKPNSGNIDKRYAGYLEIDLMDCIGGGYRQREPQPGQVCVRAFFDEDDVVRTIEVIRVHPWVDFEEIRQAAIARYGTVSESSGGGAMMAWGPGVDGKLLNYKWPQGGFALTLHAGSPRTDLFGNNSRPKVNITLQLTDPEWAASAKPLR